MNHTESLFVGKSRISQKEKKHWLWMMDGQHLFESSKWKKDHKANIHMHNDSNINNHGFIFQFWVNLRFKTFSPGPPWAVAMHYHFVEFPILSQEEIWWERDFFFFFFSFWRIRL
jgi:hypothetical protein